MQKDIRTKSFVLRRTNFGESDRILNLLTEEGYASVMAKGVRKLKSKLAGGIEMFCLNEITYHEGKNNKIGILTSSKMLKCYDKIPISLEKLEFASTVLRSVNQIAESTDASVYFSLVRQIFEALNGTVSESLIETWFWFNFAKLSGEDINLVKDTSGDPLVPDIAYVWDVKEKALRPQMGGFIGVNEIKLMRFILSSNLSTIAHLSDAEKYLPAIFFVAKSINNL